MTLAAPTWLTRETWTNFLPYIGFGMFIHGQNKLEITPCNVHTVWNGELMRYLLPDPASSPAWRAQRHKSTPVSPTPACPHCYLDKAQFGLLKPSPQGLPGIGSFLWISKMLSWATSPNYLALRSLFNHIPRCLVALPWDRFVFGQNAAQHLNHCLNVQCGLLFFTSYTYPPPPCSQLSSGLQRAEVRPYFLCTFAWELCPFICHCEFVSFCPMSISMQEVLLYISLLCPV